jgi:hypothetical protein
MNTVLKKAGIVVATAAAGLLAVSPLAFAGDYSGDNGDHGHHHHHSSDDHHHHSSKAGCKLDNGVDQSGRNEQRGGLVNVQNTNVQVPVQACNNSVVEGVLGILAKGQSNKDRH